jgi:hypothetical protein
MSTLFDTAVYQLRKSAPFAKPSIVEFIHDKIVSHDGPITLKCEHRHSVATRVWWTLEWFEDGQRFEVSASDWSLCMWRAIQVHKQNERRRELEDKPVTKGPGFFAAESKGWEGGDGI